MRCHCKDATPRVDGSKQTVAISFPLTGLEQTRVKKVMKKSREQTRVKKGGNGSRRQ